MSQYQLLPDLTDDEFAALRDDIAARGVMVPIELDEAGNILDGHHRLRACYDLGITDFPTIIRPGMTEQEKRHHVRALNLDRRHLTQEQKRAVIADILRDEPERSNRDVAAEVKVDDHTVGAVRRELEATAEIPQLDRTVGQDGKSRPATRPAIVATGKRETAKALSILQEQPEAAPDGPVTVPVLAKAAGIATREQRRAEAAETGRIASLPDAVQIVTGDFRDAMAGLPDESVHLIFTDPPYDEGSIPLYRDLAETAARVLVDGGSLITYAGHYAVPDILTAMQEHLRFWWLCGVKHSGASARLPGKWVFVEWKPLLWFVKGGRRSSTYVADMVVAEHWDKDHHDWQQDLATAAYYIETLTNPGETVVDPFCGSGTTALAALQSERRAIAYELDAETADIARGRIAAVDHGHAN